jgi:hypothetical protein
MTHDFTNKAIFCKTWQQMLHLADLARGQGYAVIDDLFNEDDFKSGMEHFVAEEGRCANVSTQHLRDQAIFLYSDFITPTTFITPPVDDSVYGC